MKTERKTKLDPEDLNIVLAEELCDEEGNFYDWTLQEALDEILGIDYLIACDYGVTQADGKRKLTHFLGWTKDKVIYSVEGLFYEDCLLASVPRHPLNKDYINGIP